MDCGPSNSSFNTILILSGRTPRPLQYILKEHDCLPWAQSSLNSCNTCLYRSNLFIKQILGKISMYAYKRQYAIADGCTRNP